MGGIPVSAAVACATALLLFAIVPPTFAYRIKGSEDEHKPFVPYERGFVQNVQDPETTANRPRVNHGYATSVLLGDGVGKNRLFSCPSMVGPFGDDPAYYCRGEEYGVCDRRSGTCFCHEGYAGEACEGCAPTHFEVGGLCYPKKVCPNDCSYAGQCNYLTGSCECSDHREGEDCSKSRCSGFHQFCTHCNDEGCLECQEGFSVHRDAPSGSQCEPCWRFDPRCRDCSTKACTSCVDLLLLSIHRSGRRPQDPPLPVDELMRELSVTVPFGSHQEDAFYDAEDFFLVDPGLVPLNQSAVECHQGLNYDDSITCLPYNLTSHIMCGNHGTITFESPEYAMREDGKQIRLTLQRSGGGVGEVSVSYSIYPITAGYEDVTSSAYYTGNQTVIFRPGQIRASFLLTINDDCLMEPNETFSVHLSNPTGSARLGTQSRTIVTIIDDDQEKTCSNETTFDLGESNVGPAEAGTPFRFSVFAKTCAGDYQRTGGDIFRIEAHKLGAENVPNGFDAPSTVGSCDDLHDGSYNCNANATASGNYQLDIYQLVPGGLRGYYYTDNYLSRERLDMIRTDAVVNFTWGMGAVTTFGRDFVSVRWEGYVRPLASELYTFALDVDDHARLWIEGSLLIDSWAFSPTRDMLHAEHYLKAHEMHEVVLEYRDVLGNATARLLWSSPDTAFTAIPSSSLFYKEHIQNSPYSYRVQPGSTSARETRAFGQGLFHGIAGKSHVFTIKQKDRFGNFRGNASQFELDGFVASAELINGDGSGLGNSLIPVVIAYNDDSEMYTASYVPRTAGVYQLNITQGSSRENHIHGSPFLVHTEPGATFAPESVAYGGDGNCLSHVDAPCTGTEHGMAGENSTFTIQAFDLNRNRREVGGDNWKVKVSSSTNDYHDGIIEDHENGTYTITVSPSISGPNELSISLNDSPLQGSPFRMNVVHGHVEGTSSHVVDEDDVNTMVAMIENTVLIQVTDAHANNAVFCDQSPFDSVISVDGDDSIDHGATQVSYVGSGKYLITVTPLKLHIDLSIKVNGLDIKGSPFNARVHPGPLHASSSSATGLGIHRSRAGHEASFIIQSKDLGGNDKAEDRADFDVYLVLMERSPMPVTTNISDDEVVVWASQEYIGDGKYLATYTCYVSGEYALHVKNFGWEAITGSPFNVTVDPAVMSAPHTLVVGQGIQSGVAGELAEVRVYGRDKYGNFVRQAVQTVEMILRLKSRHQSNWESHELNNRVGTEVHKQLAQDGGEGIFVLDYIPKFSGAYEMELSTHSPGGLKASYYSSPDLLPDYLTLAKLDKDIEIYWEDNSSNISELVGTRSHFGSVWNGLIVADHSEEYRIVVECNDGAFSSHAIDGKYSSWQSCYPQATTSIAMKANKPVQFSLRYKTLSASTDAFIVLKWASASTSMQKIPSSNLYHKVAVGNNTLYPIISPNKAHPSQSTAVGDSLRSAISGIEQEFLVESRDEYANGVVGNLLTQGGTEVTVVAVHYQNEGNIQIRSIADNDNGTSTVQYTPDVTGIYLLSITIHGGDIKESPFLLRVESGETDPLHTVLLDVETVTGVTGQEIQLEVQTMDINGNNRHKGDDDMRAVMIASPGEKFIETLDCNVDYATAGLYSITCPAASHSGRYSLDISIATSSGVVKSIKSSPFDVTIYPGNAVPETTDVISGSASNQNVNFISEAGIYESFVLGAKDLFGNPLRIGGNNFVALVRGDTNIEPSEELMEVIDQRNGNYVVTYRVNKPSTYNIHISMVTVSGLLGEYYLNETGFKEGTPDNMKIDEQINFNIRHFDADSLFSNIRWIGFVSFPHTSTFEFELAGAGGDCKLWISDRMVVLNKQSNIGSFRAIENVLYEIKIEYLTDTHGIFLQLFWSSRKMQKQIVPNNHLFSSEKPIKGSPFHLTVLP